MAETRPDPNPNATPNPSAESGQTQQRADPSRDGLVGIYALRILDRGVEPRALIAAHHAIRYGQSGRPYRPLPTIEQPPPIVNVGRAAAAAGHAVTPTATATRAQAPVTTRRARRLALPSATGLAGLLFGQRPAPARPARRLVTAGFAIAAVLGFGAVGVSAGEQPIKQPSVVSVPRS